MYSMKEACALTGMTYENLKFYCKEGLVPNVKRDSCGRITLSGCQIYGKLQQGSHRESEGSRE
jgi:predicted site-specific integrase-resolvase